jgi:hypothetical protein
MMSPVDLMMPQSDWIFPSHLESNNCRGILPMQRVTNLTAALDTSGSSRRRSPVCSGAVSLADVSVSIVFIVFFS